MDKPIIERRIAELETALKECLHVWEANDLLAYVSCGKYIDDIVNGALFATEEPEHPDTVRLRTIGRALYRMDRRELDRWLDGIVITQTGEVYSYDPDSLRAAIDKLPGDDRG